jgi:predicted HTH domain antitoxin
MLETNQTTIKPNQISQRQKNSSFDDTNIHLTLTIPKKVLLAEKMDEMTFAHELRLLAAVKLYELGRLSSGRAAELADMPRVEFLLTLNRYQMFPLAAELNDLEQHNA